MTHKGHFLLRPQSVMGLLDCFVAAPRPPPMEADLTPEARFETWLRRKPLLESEIAGGAAMKLAWLAAFAAGRREGQAEGVEEAATIAEQSEPQPSLTTSTGVARPNPGHALAAGLRTYAQQRREGR